MPIERRVSHSDPAKYQIPLIVHVNRDTLTIVAMTVRYLGIDYFMPAAVYIAKPSPVDRRVTATLLKSNEDGRPWVYFQDSPVGYDSTANTFIHTLLFFDLPANTTNIENQMVVVMTIEP